MKKLTFYIDKFCIVTDKSQIDLREFSAIKRRLSELDKGAICAINSVFCDEVEQIVFVSRYGEFDRLKKIIQEAEENNEVSPAKFSGSVHNYPAGCFNFTKQLNIPYTALSASGNSISAALTECAVMSKTGCILLCYCDYFEENLQCFSCLVSNIKLSDGSEECEFEKYYNESDTDEYKDICDFLTGKSSCFDSNLCRITRKDK